MKRRFTPPNIVKGLDDKVVISYPKEPIQIGTAKDGKPIWFDPSDLILTPDQKLHQQENMTESDKAKALHDARLSVAARAEMWMALCMARLIPENIGNNKEQTEAWLKEKDVNYAELNDPVEGVHKFILRMGDKVISEFVAKIKPV